MTIRQKEGRTRDTEREREREKERERERERVEEVSKTKNKKFTSASTKARMSLFRSLKFAFSNGKSQCRQFQLNGYF